MIKGFGEVLKKVNSVKPSDSPIISGGIPCSHSQQGLGACFIPQTLII
ncbi:hypothetical protein O2K51_02275 [Apibacter raozihei]|nr:hypothetical protein [Apibacter raozihei]